MLTISIIGIAIGLLGVIVPILPGIGLIYLSILFYSAMTGFEIISLGLSIVMLIITLIAIAIGYFMSFWVNKKLGLSPRTSKLSFGGGIIGLLIAKAPGLLLGQLIGAITGEMIDSKNTFKALKAGGISLVSFVTSIILQLIAALSLILIFSIKVLF